MDGSVGLDFSDLFCKSVVGLLYDIVDFNVVVVLEYLIFDLEIEFGEFLSGLLMEDGDLFEVCLVMGECRCVFCSDVCELCVSGLLMMLEEFEVGFEF